MASKIEEFLNKILSSRYGKDVRQAIHDGIHQCYEDGKAGATDLVAREQIANLVANNNPTEGNSELIDMRTAYDGKIYPSAGEAMRKSSVALLYTMTNMVLLNTFFESTNMFNKDDPKVLRNKYIDTNGSIREASGNFVSHKILVHKGVTYKFPHSGIASKNFDIVAYFNDDNTTLEIHTFTQNDNYCVFNAPKTGIICVNIKNVNTFMFCELEKYPLGYAPYALMGSPYINYPEKNIYNIIYSYFKNQPDKVISPQCTTFVDQISSDNLFNKNSDDIIKNAYFDINTGELVSNNNMVSVYIPINMGDYCYTCAYGFYGINNANKVALYDANKKYISTIVGTNAEYSSNKYSTHVRITKEQILNGARYIGYSLNYNMLEYAMFMNSTELTEDYIPYSNAIYIPELVFKKEQISQCVINPLYKKIAVFDGDSICSGDSVGAEDPTYRFGWAGRIGIRNNMEWYNEGVGGGTITKETYSGDAKRHWVSENIDNIYMNHPNLDYLILEGGTNDADLLNEELQMGTYTDGNYTGPFDDTTFCGALETLFQKAIDYFAGAKIGFIIAQKMGYGARSFTEEKNKRYRYFKKTMEICKKWGIPYLNLWDECYLNPNLTSCYDHNVSASDNIHNGKMYIDGQHLTSKGYEYISSIIEDWMKRI